MRDRDAKRAKVECWWALGAPAGRPPRKRGRMMGKRRCSVLHRNARFRRPRHFRELPKTSGFGRNSGRFDAVQHTERAAPVLFTVDASRSAGSARDGINPGNGRSCEAPLRQNRHIIGHRHRAGSARGIAQVCAVARSKSYTNLLAERIRRIIRQGGPHTPLIPSTPTRPSPGRSAGRFVHRSVTSGNPVGPVSRGRNVVARVPHTRPAPGTDTGRGFSNRYHGGYT